MQDSSDFRSESTPPICGFRYGPLSLDFAGSSVHQKRVHFLNRGPAKVPGDGVFEHGGCGSEFEGFLQSRKFQQTVDQPCVKGISATDSLDDVRDLVVTAFEKLLSIVNTRRPRIV